MCRSPPAPCFNSLNVVKCAIKKRVLESNEDEEIPGTSAVGQRKSPCPDDIRHRAEATGGSRGLGGCLHLSREAGGACRRAHRTKFTSFWSGGLPCGRGAGGHYTGPAHKPGTGNSEAENRSLLGRLSLLPGREFLCLAAGNGRGSSLGTTGKETKKQKWDGFTFHAGTKGHSRKVPTLSLDTPVSAGVIKYMWSTPPWGEQGDLEDAVSKEKAGNGKESFAGKKAFRGAGNKPIVLGHDQQHPRTETGSRPEVCLEGTYVQGAGS